MKIIILVIVSFLILVSCSSPIEPVVENRHLNIGIEVQSHVKIELLNSYKTLIQTLMDEEVSAGSYQINLPSELPKGIYFVKLKASGVDGSYLEDMKMLIIGVEPWG